MRGVTTINLYTGQVEVIAGKAVILCTGGGGRIFPFTTNAAINTGDGMALAYRAGIPLKDMEFVQYHPTGLPGPVSSSPRLRVARAVGLKTKTATVIYRITASAHQPIHLHTARWSLARATSFRAATCRN